MSNLSVSRALIANTNPTEAQFDLMRNDLLTFFNTTRDLDQNNIANGSMSYTSLGTPPDNEPMRWTSDHATIKYNASSDKFELKNSQGDIIFGHKVGSTITEFLSVRKIDGALEVWGELSINEDTGSQAVQLQWLLSRYRKPRLVYQDDNIFTIEDNSPTSGETLIMGRDRLWKVVDRTCSLAVNANGETSGDTGAAVSGLAQGLTRTADRWYFIYAVEVQYGSNADGINCILVAHTTSPVPANITTLNTAFGSGKWVYMGCIRNGYNLAGSDNIIAKFVVDESGYTRFYDGESGNYPVGVVLASDNDTDNLVYTVAIGNTTDISLPEVATRVMFGGHRESHGFEIYYEEGVSNERHMRTTGCYHVSELSELTPVIYIEVPLLSGYEVHIIMGNVQTNKRVTLAGFLDHYA